MPMVREYVYSPHYDFFIDKVKREKGYDMKGFHLHKKYELYYEVEGSRRYFIDDNTYIINPGNVVMIGQDSVHKTGSVGDMSHSRYVLNFTPDYLQELSGAFPCVDFLACFNSELHVLQISPRQQSLVEQLFFQLWETREAETETAVALRKLRLAELLIMLDDCTQKAKEKHDAQGKVFNETIEGVQSYISARYNEPLTLAGIAGQFYISEHYLSRLFKKTTGLSVVEYINSIRLTEAKNMLENTGMKVAEVGEAAGFGTTTHFSRVFKDGTGLSPQQYRKLYHNAQKDN